MLCEVELLSRSRGGGGAARARSWWLYVSGILASATIVGASTVPHFSQFHFMSEPSDVVTRKGGTALFNCAAYHGDKAPGISWEKDAEVINLQGEDRRLKLDNGSLYITNVQHSRASFMDAGAYQCFATVAGLGTIVSKTAHLRVSYMAQHFKIEPKSLNLYLDDVAMLECLIDGIPSPTYSWYKDGQKVIEKSNIQIYPDGVLEIRSIKFSDFGEYVCEAENMDRSRKSHKKKLEQNADFESIRQGVAPSFIMKPKDSKVIRGSSVILYCGANGRNRKNNQPTITWLKDGITVNFLNGSFSLVGQGNLRISNVQGSHSGIYTCRADNMEDSVDADAMLTVLVPPTFVKRPKNVFAHESSEVIFECDIYGVPKPEITWMKDGDFIEPTNYFQIVEQKNLRIRGLLDTDDGLYQCFGKNELGDIQASAQLVILKTDVPLPTTPSQTSPTIPLGSVNIDSDNLPSAPTNLIAAIVSTSFVTLSWRIPERTGPSEILVYKVFWKEKESMREQVLNTSTQEANIQHLKPNTEYIFKVLAYNRIGPGKDMAMLTVTTGQEVYVPAPATNVKATALSSTSIMVKWNAPKKKNGGIKYYHLIYYEVGANGEAEIKVHGLSHTLSDLKKFREYSFRVVAYNENGPGTSTEEYVAKTFAAVPSATPQNFTLETASSTSIIVRWEPPPEDEQNGVITGYKIHYKRRGHRRGDTVTTAGNRRLFALTDLNKGTEYQVRISALTVKGTGPKTKWMFAETYEDDLDESIVPPKPARIRAQPEANSIIVRWSPPPADSKILVRGYTLGYGRGIPDVLQVELDAQHRVYRIENLQPASEYVITVKAFNNIGDGEPIYETVTTEEESASEPVTPMMPPIGLKTIVLSANTIVVTWTDTSLGRSQRITDSRYYTVQYAAAVHNKKYKYVNSTDLNAHIDDLKPNTQYEFSVKVIKGRRLSTWSMSVLNTTLEAAPGGVPRDLTPVAVEGNPKAVTLSWQPPQRPNGRITGYLVFYTTDSHQEDRDWVVQDVLGDILSSTIKELTPDTTYYFKVQARNSKGYGPMSPTVVYRTPKADGTGGGLIQVPDIDQPDRKFLPTRKYLPEGKSSLDVKRPNKGGNKKQNSNGNEGGISRNAMIIIIACVVGVSFCIVVVVVAIVICRRREYRNKRTGGNYMSPAKTKSVSKGPLKDVKPPDLWIHHDHLELKNMDKSEGREQSVSVAPTQRNPDGSKVEDMPSGIEMDQRRNSSTGESSYHPAPEERYARGIIRPKPIMIPVEAQPLPREPTIPTVTAVPNGHLQAGESSQQVSVRPVYPRTQYNTQYSTPPRVHAGDVSQPSSKKLTAMDEDEPTLTDSLDDPYLSRIGYGPKTPDSPSPHDLTCKSPDSTQDQSSCTTSTPEGSKSLPTRPTHPLKSFSVPGPPPQSAPGTPTPKHIVKPQQSTSPYKRPNPPVSSGPIKPRSPMPIVTPKAPDVTLKSGKEEADMQKSLSTEELTAEMANLEGLMKDLNAITQQEFEC